MITFIPIQYTILMNFSQILSLDNSLRLNGPTINIGEENSEPGLPLETNVDAGGSRLAFILNFNYNFDFQSIDNHRKTTSEPASKSADPYCGKQDQDSEPRLWEAAQRIGQ